MGLSPSELLGLDLEVYEDVLAAANERWTHSDELLATITEQLDTLIRLTVRAHSDPKKNLNLPKPFRYPRPGDKGQAKRTVSPAQLAARMRG